MRRAEFLRAVIVVMAACGAQPGTAQDMVRIGVGATPCSDVGQLSLATALPWAEGYWTAYNIVLADNCLERRDTSALSGSPLAAWAALRAFCSSFPKHDFQGAAYGLLMQQPVADVPPKPQCVKDDS